MAINAGTVLAYLDMDTSKYTNALQTAQSQLTSFADEGSGLSGVVDGIGTSLTTIGTALTATLTTSLLGAGIAAVSTGLKFDESMSNVAALSGTTGEKFDELRAKALEMGSSTKYTASEAADAMGYMALAGWDADQMMAGLPGVLSLAAAANMDLATASDIVTDTMTPFGLAASEASRVSDVFAKTQATSNTTVEALGEAMKYAASNADAFGMTIEQTSAVIGLFANSGIKGSMAGTTLTSMLTDMKNAAVDGSIAIGDTAVSLVDSQGNYREFADIFADIESATDGMSESQRDAALSAVFQTRGLKGILALLKQGSDALYDYTDELENADGAAEEMADTMQDNLKGDLTILKSGIEGAAIALSDYLVPALRKGVQWITNAVAWFNGLDDGIKNTVFRIGAIAAAIGPALLVGGKLISLFSGIIPVAGLLAAGFALVYNHSERLQNFVETTKESIPEWIEGIKGGYDTFRTSISEGQSTIDALQSGLEAAFGDKVASNAGRVMRTVQSGFQTAKRYITNGVNGVGEFIGSLIDGEDAATAMQEALEAAFGEEFSLKAQTAVTYIGSAISSAKSKAITFAQSARETLSTLWNDVQEDFETGGFMGVVTDIGGRLKELLINGAGTAEEGAVSVKDRILNGLSIAKETLTSKAQTVMTWLGEAYNSETVQAYIGDISSVSTMIWSKIQWAKSTLTDKAAEWINALGTEMGSDEVKDKVTEITGVAATIAGKITSGIGTWKTTAATLIGGLIAQLTDNGFLETAVTGLGNIVTAIAKGIAASAENITGCAATLISTLSRKFVETGFIETVFTTAGAVVLSIAGALKNSATNMATAASSLAVALLNGLNSLNWTEIFTTAGSVVLSIAGVLARSASSMATAASNLAVGLLNGLGSLNWTEVFTGVGSVISSIAKVISDNAGTIASAALSLAISLLEGLAAVDWTTLSYNISMAVSSLTTAISDWIALPENSQKILDLGGEIAGGIVKGLWQGFVEDIKDGWENDPILNAIRGLFDTEETGSGTQDDGAGGDGRSFGSSLASDVNSGFSDTIDIETTATTAAQGGVDAVSTTLTGGEGDVQAAAQGVADAATTVFEGLPEDTRAQAALTLTAVNEAIEAGTPEAQAAIEVAATAVIDQANLIMNSNTGSEIGRTFLSGVIKGMTAMQIGLTTVANGLGTVGVTALKSQMSTGTGFSIGQSMVQAVISGASSLAGSLDGKFYSLGSSAVSAFKSAIRMASPPKAFTEIGEAIPDAVGLGTDNNRNAALNPIIELAHDMVNAFDVSLSDDAMTGSAHTTSTSDGNGTTEYSFHFYGDMTVRDDSDIERISQQIYAEIKSELRGGGALA